MVRLMRLWGLLVRAVGGSAAGLSLTAGGLFNYLIDCFGLLRLYE